HRLTVRDGLGQLQEPLVPVVVFGSHASLLECAPRDAPPAPSMTRTPRSALFAQDKEPGRGPPADGGRPWVSVWVLGTAGTLGRPAGHPGPGGRSGIGSPA